MPEAPTRPRCRSRRQLMGLAKAMRAWKCLNCGATVSGTQYECQCGHQRYD